MSIALSQDRLFMWAGGKTKMLAHYTPLLPPDVLERSYVEPFAGGAALFGWLGAQRPLDALLSDVNRELIGLYQLVKADPCFLIREMDRYQDRWIPLDLGSRKSLYYEARARYWEMPEGPEMTALLYFLMRTGFNGIWQTCKASRGRFATPVGLANQKSRIYDRNVVMRWNEKLAKTELLAASFDQISIPRGAFVFCDPPYRSSFTSYGQVFDDTHQEALIEWCRQTSKDRGATIWMSNRDSGDGFFETLAPDARITRFPITYTAGRRRKTADGFEAKPATELLLQWEPAR